MTTSTTEVASGPPLPLNGSYYVKVEQFGLLSQHAEEQFALGRPAVLVLGAHSTGAAEACRRLCQERAKAKSAIYVQLSTAAPLTKDSRGTPLRIERAFDVVMRELMMSWGARLVRTPEYAIGERVVRRILTDSRDFGGRLVIFVDLRNPGELEDVVHLAHLHEQLVRHGCSVEFVLLYSKLDTAALHQLSKSTAARPIAARWLGGAFPWPALPLSSLAKFLRAYDQIKRRGESQTICERFAPHWWARGGRMEALEIPLRAALSEASKAAGRGACSDVPIGMLARICEAALSSTRTNESMEARVARVVRNSGLGLHWSLTR